MATPKKNTTTKVEQNALPVSLKPSNANEFPMVYADNIWHIAAAGSAMADEMGNSGQFDQQTINEQLATLIASALADIVLFKKTDGTAGSIKKIVDDAIAAVVSDAPAAFDTLKELSDWIAGHTQDASAMNTAIQGKVDKVEGKGLSENDYTDTEKSKLAEIESGAEVNIIDGITINGVNATIANKKVAFAIPLQYVYICKNYGRNTSVTITAVNHGCGTMPIVVCYLDNKIIELDVSKNASGDVTIGWNGTTTISAQNPLTICIMGMSVTPEEEEQPTPSAPDASDFPYLTFSKTNDGECSVSVNWEEEFTETSVDIPAAVMLNGEELAVTAIEDSAFSECQSLTSVTIPNSVITIGNDAFTDCANLESVTIGSGVESIGDYAFKNCSSLASVTIPNSVTSIGSSAFYDCSNLETLTIGSGVETIGAYAFYYCTALTSAAIPDSVTTIGDYAFEGCANLESVTIGNSVETIGGSAFIDCANLESVTIGNSVETIGESAFSCCTNLESVTIGNSVETIGESAFSGCTNLESVTIGNSVETIGESAFSNCSSLAEITIPNSVTTIGYYAFAYCTNLESVTIGNSVETIGQSAFYECSSLAEITIPDSVTTIGNEAFASCTNLESVTIGNSVETIGESAFEGCTGLTSIIIPNSVTTISNGAFSSLDSNCTIYCEASSQPAGWDSDWTSYPENVVWGYTPSI